MLTSSKLRPCLFEKPLKTKAQLKELKIEIMY